MGDIIWLDRVGAFQAECVGGKAFGLARLLAAGLPVPAGFCITTAACRRLRGQGPHADPSFMDQVRSAYKQLDATLVAIRSSATLEDGEFASFAGQQETIIGVRSEDELFAAIGRCWASLDSERVQAYCRQHGLAAHDLAMGVIVQRVVCSEVAGVLVTRDPLAPSGQRVLVEASWGMGESVASGKVSPDRFYVDWDTGRVVDRNIGVKSTMRFPGGERAVEPDRQSQPSLNDVQLGELASLGRRIEACFGAGRDVEWAWADGQFWILQARPITVAGAVEREQVRQEEIATLQKLAAPEGTVWSRFGLAETLPEPTPMTWAIVRRFLSGNGALGQMYRDLGFDPDPALADIGIYDLVCGRPYCNLSREPRMQYHGLPLEHSFAQLKANPSHALSPQPVVNPAHAGWRLWLRLPGIIGRLTWSALRLRWQQATFLWKFSARILPRYLQQVEREKAIDLTQREPAELLDHLERCIRLTLVEFGRESLKPTVFASLAAAKLERWLKTSHSKEQAVSLLPEFLAVEPNSIAELPQQLRVDLRAALCEVAAGRLSRAKFLNRFGHRGGQEMELAQPRWDEQPEAVEELAKNATATVAPKPGLGRRRHAPKWVAGSLSLFVILREAAKHHLMKGYALIRRVLVELDRRFQLRGGIFFLTPDELPRLVTGEDFTDVIRQRRQRRMLALSLEVPQVLFSDDLEAIGRPVEIAGADVLQGVPVSAGVAEGVALVLHQPDRGQKPSSPCILVCPSGDPAWVPLFVNARGVVMETGGVLSHGAIVAREFGLPAVAGVPGVSRHLRTGQRIRVDGLRGQVVVLDEAQ